MVRIGVACILLSTMAARGQGIMFEASTNRAGGDYFSFPTPFTQDCASACLSDNACKAYTYILSSKQCFLKSVASAPTTNQCCTSGARNGVTDLKIVVANMKGSDHIPETGVTDIWYQRYPRLASLMKSADSAPPDIISLTEIDGWETCGWQLGDYDSIDLIIASLRTRFGVTYRIAHMVGRPWFYAACTSLSGNVVLYNPARIVHDVNVDRMTSFVTTLVPHDAAFYGTQLRRSLPYCYPGAQTSPVLSLIDGASSVEKCITSTPEGPAWTLVRKGIDSKGHAYDKVIATAVRFSFSHDTRQTFDYFTLHPNSDSANGDQLQTADLVSFVSTFQGFTYRLNAPIIPAIAVGDVNHLVRTPWLPGFTEFAISDPGDVMSMYMGNKQGPAHTATFGFSGVRNQHHYPNEMCGPFPGFGFSDHCALQLDFETEGKQVAPLPLIWPAVIATILAPI